MDLEKFSAAAEAIGVLGLKVSQFVGLMGDEPPAPEDELHSAQAARQHIEQLVARLIREAG